MPRPSLITDALLDAIARAESNNRPSAVGDAGLAIGAYHMQPIAYQDVQRVFPQEFGAIPYDRLKTDPALQRRAARAYLQAGEQAYGITDLSRLVAFYNAGPKARSGPLINQPYVDKVLRFMGGPQSMAPMTNHPQRFAGLMQGVAQQPGQMMGMVPHPQDGQPQTLGDALFAMNQSVVSAGMQPLSDEEVRAIAQKMQGVGQPTPTPMLGQAPPQNPLLQQGGLLRQGMA